MYRLKVCVSDDAAEAGFSLPGSELYAFPIDKRIKSKKRRGLRNRGLESVAVNSASLRIFVRWLEGVQRDFARLSLAFDCLCCSGFRRAQNSIMKLNRPRMLNIARQFVVLST